MTLLPTLTAVRAAVAATLLAGSGSALAHPGHDEVPGLLADLAHGLGFDPAPVAAASVWLALALLSVLAARIIDRLRAARRSRHRPPAGGGAADVR